jgi:hypothetical protein
MLYAQPIPFKLIDDRRLGDYVKSAFTLSCYNAKKKSIKMPSSRTFSVSLILCSATYFIGATSYEPSQSADEDIQRLFSLYMDARSSGMMDEADILAKQIVERSILSFGRNSKDTARALTSLGTLQTSNQENIAAIQNFAAAIDIVEIMDGNLSIDLLSPLKAMGAAQLQAGNGDGARDAWIRAVHISHVNLGPHTLEQIETLQAMVALYSRAEMSKEERIVRRQIKYLQYRYSTIDQQEIVPETYDTTEGMIPIGNMESGSEYMHSEYMHRYRQFQ